MQTVSLITAFFTVIIAFVSQWKKNKNIIEITPIGFILQFGSYFDIWSFLFRNNFNLSSTLSFLYSVSFPLFLISSQILARGKKNILPVLMFFIIPVFCYFIEYKIIYRNIFPYWFLFILVLYILTIIVCFRRCFNLKFKFKPYNYFYFLLLGFVIIDLFYNLGFYQIIDFRMSIWVLFLNFFLIYLNLLRIIYIIYVSKNF
jgi:hypothetical protein